MPDILEIQGDPPCATCGHPKSSHSEILCLCYDCSHAPASHYQPQCAEFKDADKA